MGQFNISIREKREAAGLTQHQLAARSGIQQSRISQYETGKLVPKMESLARIAKVLKCEIGDIVNF